MMVLIIAVIAGLISLVPAGLLAMRLHKSPRRMTRSLIFGLGSYDLVLALMMIGIGLVWFFSPSVVQAAGLTAESDGDTYASIAAAIAVSVGSISAAYAVSTVGSAAVGAIAEKPEIFGRALIFVGLAEGVAIYGLIIAFIILS